VPSDWVDAYLDRVADETTFLAFLHALATDRAAAVERERSDPSPYGPDAAGWECSTIEAYLAAAAAWASDSRRSGKHESSENVWKRVADILYAGTLYE
jgi:hypothetical protein